jgi:hypothetical protein
MASMDSSLAASMNPQVLTTRTSAQPAGAGLCPAARSRASRAPESASFLGQPSVWMKKVLPVGGLRSV